MRRALSLIVVISLTACSLLPGAATPIPEATLTLAPTDTVAPPPTSAPSATTAASSTPPPVTDTPAPPTNSAETATPAPPTNPAETATPLLTDTPTVTPTATLAPIDRVEFVADVTVPDGEAHKGGETFVKTWRLKNSGTSTWTTDYALVFVSGDQMNAPKSVPLPSAVAPEQTVDISVNLTAPNTLGAHTGFWLMRNTAGDTFGLGSNRNVPIYVQISVSTTASGTPAPTPSGSTAPGKVTGVTLRVDKETVSGTCPQTLVFTGIFTIDGSGSVTYHLEIIPDRPGFQLDLPAPITGRFERGMTFGLAYTLDFNDSINGQAILHITTPNKIDSSPVAFSLTCQNN